jgi:hypothetical protein
MSHVNCQCHGGCRRGDASIDFRTPSRAATILREGFGTRAEGEDVGHHCVSMSMPLLLRIR